MRLAAGIWSRSGSRPAPASPLLTAPPPVVSRRRLKVRQVGLGQRARRVFAGPLALPQRMEPAVPRERLRFWFWLAAWLTPLVSGMPWRHPCLAWRAPPPVLV